MDRAEAVRKLVPVFRQYGYEGATLARISQATGLGRASLYHHFPDGKKEMANAVLEHIKFVVQAQVLDPLLKSGDPLERLQTMTDQLNQFYDRGQSACFLAIFSLGESDSLFHPHIQQALQAWINALESVLLELDLPAAIAQQRAEDAVMQIQGALVVSRGLQETSLFQRVLEQLPKRLAAPSPETVA